MLTTLLMMNKVGQNKQMRQRLKSPSLDLQMRSKESDRVHHKGIRIIKYSGKAQQERKKSGENTTLKIRKPLCEIPKSKQFPRFLRSSSQAQLDCPNLNKKLQQRSSLDKKLNSPSKSPYLRPNNASNPEMLTLARSLSRNRWQRRNTDNDLKQKCETLQSQNSALRKINETLNAQLLKTKDQINAKEIQVKELQFKIDILTTSINELKQQQALQQKLKVDRSISEQGSRISQKQRSLSSGPSKEKQTLEKFLQDIDKNFDEIINLDKLHSDHSSVEQHNKHYETISKLNEKVRTLEIQNSMLKRFKYQIRQFRAKGQKLKGQVKILSNKLKFLSGHAQTTSKDKDALDYTISFEFSLGDDGHPDADKRKFRD